MIMKYKISKKALYEINKFYHNVAKKYRNTWSKEDVKKYINQTKSAIYQIENGLPRRKPSMQRWHGLYMTTSKDKRWNFAYRIQDDTVYVEDASHAQNIHEMVEYKNLKYYKND